MTADRGVAQRRSSDDGSSFSLQDRDPSGHRCHRSFDDGDDTA